MPTTPDPSDDPLDAASAGLSGPSSGSTASRRVVLGAVAGGAASLGAGPAIAGRLPRVRPLRSHAVYRSFGVNALANQQSTNYRFHRQWLQALDGMNVSFFRGLYVPGLAATSDIVAEARARGIEWGMGVAPDRHTRTEDVVAVVRHIARHAAKTCLFIEGVNEPNYVRGVGPAGPGWERDAVRIQRAIWRTVASEPRLRHVTVLGPSLQDVSATVEDFRRLRQLGLLDYMDVGGIHRYPNGGYPDHDMNRRLAVARRGWPRTPIWITETGYTNALATTSGHRPVPESVAAQYAPTVLLEAVDRGCRTMWFEVLDDVDPGPKDDREANFGLFAIQDGEGPPWRSKPAANELRTFLARLRDPGPVVEPRRVAFRVRAPSGDVRATLTAKRNGVVTAHLRRATRCWDPEEQRPIDVQPTRARVETAGRVRFVMVDHRVTSITL